MSRFAPAPLGELAKFINGDRGANYPSKSDFTDEGIPFINAGHLTGGGVDFSSMNYISEEKFDRLGSGKTKANDLLYCLRGSLGKTAIVHHTGHAAIASSLVIIRPAAKCAVKYLYRYLTSPFGEAEIRRFDNGSSQPNLSATSVKKYQIPLPPLAEQKRIAGILDAADALRAKRRESLAQLDTLLQSTFLDMFGDPVTNPMGCEVHALEELIQPDRPITYGILKPGPDIEDGVPYVRVVDIKNEQVLTDQLRRTTQEIASQYKRSQLIAGDLLMSIRGHVGRMAIVPTVGSGGNITQDTARLALCSADPVYVMQCLSTQGMQQHMARRTKGVAVKGINLVLQSHIMSVGLVILLF